MPVFETSLTLKCSPQEAFDYLAVPVNHEKLSPPEIGLKFINPAPRLELGMKFDFKVQAYGTVQTMQHEVITFEPHQRFVEVQLRGPLKSFWHEHRFEAQGENQVTIHDRIEFEPPGGMLGFLVTADKIAESLEDGFYHRHRELRKIFGGV